MSFINMIKFALAETRRSRGKLAFCVFSIALGVMAVTGIKTVILNLDENIAKQARNLMGADLKLQSARPLSEVKRIPAPKLPGDETPSQTDTGKEPLGPRLHEELEKVGATHARMVEFYSMLYRVAESKPAPDRIKRGRVPERTTRLVRIRALAGDFPFYGEAVTRPPGIWKKILTERASGQDRYPPLLGEPAIKDSLGLNPGDLVRLGEMTFRFAGIFEKKPGSPFSDFAMAPTVYFPHKQLVKTGLTREGGRIRYFNLYKLPESVDPEAWKDKHFQEAAESGLKILTFRESADNVRRFLLNLSRFVTLVGLIALLLGALGIGSAMSVFMRDKTDHAAILRSLGASPGRVVLIYLTLATILGALGSLLGGALGSLLPPFLVGPALAGAAGGMLPVKAEMSFSLIALAQGFITGVIATVLFTLVPIIRTGRVSPLRVLRHDSEGAKSNLTDILIFLPIGLAVLVFVMLFAAYQTGSFLVALLFTGALLVALACLSAFARLLMWGTRRITNLPIPYPVKQGVANLYRPGNQTVNTLTAIGAGMLLIVTVFILETSLQAELRMESDTNPPNLFITDLQENRLEAMRDFLAEQQAQKITLTPMIASRITAVNGRPLDRSKINRNAAEQSWSDRLRTREYFISYREKLLSSEEVVEGKFWRGRPAGHEISAEQDWAERMEVDIGDSISLDIHGFPLTGKITSLRKIQWGALRPNSLLIFSPGALEAAPKMFVGSFRIEGEAARTDFVNLMAQRFPSTSVIDVTEVSANILLILNRISYVIRFLALVTVLNGIVILAGAVASGRFFRLRESTLLKVLGATPGLIRNILLVEFSLPALLGGLLGWLLAELLNRPMLASLFDISARVSYPEILLTLLLVVGLSAGLGRLISRDVSRTKPMEILREE